MGYLQSGRDRTVYNAIMDADLKYRPGEFTRLMTYGWNVGNYPKTHWGDKAYQVGGGGTYGQKLYDDIQNESLSFRGRKFYTLGTTGSFSHQCEEAIFADKSDYVDPNTGQYRDPYYDYGEGVLSGVGEMFAQVNWEEVVGYLLIAVGYIVLSLAGAFAFPPALICLWITNGNLNTCSMGVWGNGYAADQSKFEEKNADGTTKTTEEPTTKDDNSTTTNDDPNAKADPTDRKSVV